MDSVRKLQEAEGEKLRLRLVEVNDSMNDIDSSIAEIKSNIAADLQKIMQEAESKEKVLDAKIDDQGDKLRLGMLTMQSAIGEGRGGEGGEDDDGDVIPLEEVEKMQEEAMDGLRESFAKQISEIEQDVQELKTNIKQQGDVSYSQTYSQHCRVLTTLFLDHRGQAEEPRQGGGGRQQHHGGQTAPEDGLHLLHPGADEEADRGPPGESLGGSHGHL